MNNKQSISLCEISRSETTNRRGQTSIEVLIFGTVAVFMLSSFLLWADVNIKAVGRGRNKALAFTIAEAGIEYYRWHLAHASQDYQDGTATSGPYVHDFYDKNGKKIGEFTLDITPPPTGSTIVRVNSRGTLLADPSVEKIIEVRMGIPSFAKYAAVTSDNIRFGEGTEIFGAVHSNLGIRFDGLAHNLVTSAISEYDDPDHDDIPNLPDPPEFGVHTHLQPIDPLPPAAIPSRTDVFAVGRQVDIPAVNFLGITHNLSEIKAAASSSGVYVASSGSKGYELVLKTNDTYDLYRVTSVKNPSLFCSSYGVSGWGTWTINNKNLIRSGSFPSNGLFFVEDDLWVRGQINDARLTIASGWLQDVSRETSIIINNDLTYTYYDGRDALALIAQKNINIGLESENDLRIDGALVAQSGRVGRYYYSWLCGSYYIRQNIYLLGMIASNLRYGFAYTDGTGYQTRSLNYDGNFLYGPPPSFPLTTDPYTIISWDEVK